MKTSLKKWSQAASNFIALIPFRSIRQTLGLNFFLELNSKRLHRSSGKEKEFLFLCSRSSTKRESRHFHVVVVQLRQRNVQKSVMHEQSCCFANLNLLFFPFLLTSSSSLICLSSPPNWWRPLKRYFPRGMASWQGRPVFILYVNPHKVALSGALEFPIPETMRPGSDAELFVSQT